MNQCHCSSNKLGVHCYKCEDEHLDLENRVPKMCKKKVGKMPRDTYVDKHEYIPGVQCDNENCYACAKQHYNCDRLDKLDAQNKEQK